VPVGAIVVPVRHGLGHGHAHQVVPRGLKPGNTLMPELSTATFPDGRAKVTDLVIAGLATRGSMTPDGIRVGARGRRALEPFVGRDADRCAGLYATGVALLESLIGLGPLPGAARASGWIRSGTNRRFGPPR
jgi:serine/threonine protein kinase